jgi:restriction endonuclease S subunit
MTVAKLGDYIREECNPLGPLGAQEFRLIGVSNEHGLHASSRDASADLARYQRIELNWFAYNPMRVNVGSIGLADDDSKTGFTSPDYTVFSCREGLDPHYLLHFLRSDYGLESIARKCSGAVRKRLYYSGLAEIELPVPNMNEQLVLVSRINSISETIRFIREENSDRNELPQLKQAILQEAIQGKLTADWRAAHPGMESASQLLYRIQAEKARLIAGKRLRPERPLPGITSAEIPFEVPKDWEWCRFGDVQTGSDAGISPRCEERPIVGEEWGILKVSATSGTHFRQDENKFFKAESPEEQSAILREGDFILSRANTKELVGNSVLVEGLSLNLLLSDKTIRIRLSQEVSSRYVNMINKAAFVREHFIRNATGSSPSMKNLSRESIISHAFPLPPLAEQAAIVERVEVLMMTYRALEAEIEHARTHATHLLQAVLKEAFAPAP